jgi:hypothetical protein
MTNRIFMNVGTVDGRWCVRHVQISTESDYTLSQIEIGQNLSELA